MAQQQTESKPDHEPADAAPEQSESQVAQAEKPTTTSSDKAPAKTDEEKKAAKAEKAEKRAERREKGKNAGTQMLAALNQVRARIASIVWLIAVLCAAVLALGALLLALKMDRGNAIVSFFVDTAKAIDLGKFKDFTGKNAYIKEHLVDWGIAAIIYLVVGRILDRVIRP